MSRATDSVRPSTLGTFTGAGPLDTTIVTADDAGSILYGAALAVRGVFAAEGRAETASFSPPPFEFEEATIADIHAAILTKRITATELVTVTTTESKTCTETRNVEVDTLTLQGRAFRTKGVR